MILYHKHLHHCLWGLSEPHLLLLDDLLIAHLALVFLLLGFQLFLVVINDLVLFGKLLGNSLLSVNLLLLLRVLFVGYRVEILEVIKFTI